MNDLRYQFHVVDACPMCGRDASKSRVLGMRLNQSQGMHPRSKTGIAVSVCECSGCKLHFPQPLPIPENLEDHYAVPPESYWKPEHFELRVDEFADQISIAKRLIGFEPGMRALDIGAGIGKAMIAMQSAGFSVEGIEPSASFRQQAIQGTGVDAGLIQHATLEEAVFPRNSFDFITFGAVLEHLFQPGQAIERALEWLAPGGVMHIEVPSSRYLIQRLINGYFRLIGTSYVTNISPMHAPFHIYEFTLDSFARHGERIGYQVTEHRTDICRIHHFPQWTHPPLRRVMSVTDTGAQLTVWLQAR